MGFKILALVFAAIFTAVLFPGYCGLPVNPFPEGDPSLDLFEEFFGTEPPGGWGDITEATGGWDYTLPTDGQSTQPTWGDVWTEATVEPTLTQPTEGALSQEFTLSGLTLHLTEDFVVEDAAGSHYLALSNGSGININVTYNTNNTCKDAYEAAETMARDLRDNVEEGDTEYMDIQVFYANGQYYIWIDYSMPNLAYTNIIGCYVRGSEIWTVTVFEMGRSHGDFLVNLATSGTFD